MRRAAHTHPQPRDRSRSRRRGNRRVALSALIALLALAAGAWGASYFVRPDGSGDFPTLAAAIQAAQGGDEILLADGIFIGHGNRDLSFAGKALAVRSQSGDPGACVIDCQGSAGAPHRGFSFVNHEGAGSVLSGVTIRNGHDPAQAGALHCLQASPTVSDCVFTRCFGDLGGAVACENAAMPVFTRCTFEADSAGIGGALMIGLAATPTLRDCVFTHNRAGIEAGAISLQSTGSLVATDCLFTDNWGQFRGGALLADDSSTPHLTRCTLIGNSSAGGGGAYCCAASVGAFAECTFHANSATLGAQLTCGCEGVAGLDNCILAAGLQGSAVYCWSSGQAHLACCDVFGNAGGDWFGYIAPQYGVNGNFSADPLFCDAPARDLTLHAGSPCLPGHHPSGATCGLIGAWPMGCGDDAVPEGPAPSGGWRLALTGPNPCAGSIRIECAAPAGAPAASLAVFDLAGRLVRRLLPEGVLAGTQRIEWGGDDDLGRAVPTGVYFVRLGREGESALVRTIALVR